MSVYGVPKHN